MILKNLQFQLSENEREVEFIRPTALLCIRQTAKTLEFLRERADGTRRVLIVQGTNLGTLRLLILHGALWQLHLGSYRYANVSRIFESRNWSVPVETLHADPNRVRKDCLQFETDKTRDLWAMEKLELFAVPKGVSEQFLFQFKNTHSYILSPRAGSFSATLRALKESNLDVGMLNKVSTQADDRYPKAAAVDKERHQVSAITYKIRDHASDSSWDILLDYRSATSPQIELNI